MGAAVRKYRSPIIGVAPLMFQKTGKVALTGGLRWKDRKTYEKTGAFLLELLYGPLD